jgi:hypothetical protein
LEAVACSWEGISERNVARVLPDRVRDADAVVHGKVTSLKVSSTEQVVDILVLRSFKGSGSTLRVRAQSRMCGYSFSLGEEQVFFVHKGWVGIPGVEPLSAWLLDALSKVTPSPATPNTSLERTRER